MTTDLRGILGEIYAEHGKLTPDLVVGVASEPTHPLHSRFEWDDAVAGPAWRRQQAHELIRTARITFTATDEPAQGVRAFHAVRGEEGFVYHPAEKVAADPMLARLVLADMEREWRQMKARYETFSEFWELVRRDSAA